MGQVIVDGQRGGDQRPVRLVRRQAAEGGGVGEESRNIAEIPNERVFLDGMGVVEMEGILEVIGVRAEHRQQDQ